MLIIAFTQQVVLEKNLSRQIDRTGIDRSPQLLLLIRPRYVAQVEFSLSNRGSSLILKSL